MELPKHVHVCELVLRDGFQIEPGFVSTEMKVEPADSSAAAGVRSIQVAFHPKAVPHRGTQKRSCARSGAARA